MSLVTLTWYEVAEAAREGCARTIRRLGSPLRDRGIDDPWGNNIESTAAEMAFAKTLDIYWAPSGLPDPEGDVALWQVRWSSREDGHLLVYPKDPDWQMIVQVLGAIPSFRVLGAIRASEAKKSEWWTDNGLLRIPAWRVPRDVLTPVDEVIVA